MNQQQIDIGARENTDAEMEIDLLELLAYYRERIVWIILGFLAGAVIAGLITYYLITPDYTATSKMYMVSSSSQSVVDLTDLNIGQSLSKDYVELLKTRPIIESVIEEQGLDYDYAQLLSMLSMSTLSDTRIIAIRATSETPQPHIAEYAIIPVNPSSPSFSRNTMIGALIGMIIVLGIFTIRFMLDDTFKTAEDIEKEFGVIPLTVIPEGKIQGFDAGSSSAPKRKKKRKR